MIALEVEPLDLGEDIRSVGLDLIEGAEQEPVRGSDAARVWSLALPAIAGDEPWVLDFFSHAERVREFCHAHNLQYRDTSKHALVIASPQSGALLSLLERFETETFGLRAGLRLNSSDPSLEGELAHRGVDAYQAAYANYLLCGVCNFEAVPLWF